MKTTVIVGASPNPSGYAYKAASMLSEDGKEFIPLGIKEGNLFGNDILDLRKKPNLKEVDTVTVYLGPEKQTEWYEYILSLKPRRIIFNPGTENSTFASMAQKQGIMVEEACTLVLLTTGTY